MKKIAVRISLIVAVLVAVALVVIFFSLNSIVKKEVESLGPEMTRVQVRLGSVLISPIGGRGELVKLFVGNPEGYKTASAIELGDIKVRLKMGSVMSDIIVVNELNLQAPQITLEGHLTGKNNLSIILKNVSAYGDGDHRPKSEASTPTKKSPKRFIVKDLIINGGKINLNISGLGRTFSAPLSLPPLHLQNIGVSENGITADQLVKAILVPLLASVTETAVKEVGNLGGNLKNLGKNGTDELNNAAKGLKGLFH
jgi:hypothetical protein